MKRWIRRILVYCSIGLVAVTLLLEIRAQFAEDTIFCSSFVISNRNDCLLIRKVRYSFEAPMFVTNPPGEYEPGYFPARGVTLTGDELFFIPRWLLLAVGVVYPIGIWVQHRRRKQAAGFPVKSKTIDAT